MNKIFVVVTTTEDDNIADIILITPNEEKAKEITNRLSNRTALEGFDFDRLVSYESANYFERTLDSLENWGVPT